ncbi:MAG: hypothetical protein K6C36_09950 [Clostridia bacterium]|nr:hypothetical protein [Clostridia bacterium]
MKKIEITDKRLKTEGLYGFVPGGRFRRYTDGIVGLYPRLADADVKCAGARLRFRTDSARIAVEFDVSNQYVDRGMSFYQANTAYAYVGPYSSSAYAALVSADRPYEDGVIRAEFGSAGMNDVTVFFPHNPTVDGVRVYIEDGAALEMPTPHRIKLPFVFYGSSITEQGHTLTPLAYPTLLSRFFDADFYNFGASGNAKGEPELAGYLGGIEKSLFFYDYDHNAPTAEHLRRTHEAFFRRFREADPFSPVIMTSRPADDTDETEERVRIVKRTYENARRAGDENVYFLDGRTLFGDTDPAICTTDRTHPNDLGHYLIARSLEKLIRENIFPQE